MTDLQALKAAAQVSNEQWGPELLWYTGVLLLLCSNNLQLNQRGYKATKPLSGFLVHREFYPSANQLVYIWHEGLNQCGFTSLCIGMASVDLSGVYTVNKASGCKKPGLKKSGFIPCTDLMVLSVWIYPAFKSLAYKPLKSQGEDLKP